MTDWRDLAVDPDPDFRHRLEAELLRSIRTAPHPAGGTAAGVPEEEITVTIELDEPATGQRPPSRRWLGLAAAAAAVAVVAGGVVMASRDDGSTEPVAASTSDAGEVTFEVQWPDLGEMSKSCVETRELYLSADSGNCFREFLGEAALTGDIQGSALWSMMANVGTTSDGDLSVEDVAGFGVTYIVDADVAGCGSGEFMITSTLTFRGWENGQFVGDWRIVPDSGREDLAAISGSGEVLPQDGDVNQTRVHTGTISC
jgi:hypothetical protein